jgi:two-component system OmpR family response regulator
VRVLLAEDDVRMAGLIKRGLEEEAYAVDVAMDGPTALWMAQENDYAVLVLDVMLPELGGFEVCRRLRQDGRWAPVLMLSARSAVEDRVEGLDAGADDYLPKPFSFAELTARLRALTRRGLPERPTVLQVGDLSLDPASRKVHRGEVEVSLSAKEFALLEVFMRNPDLVLTRTKLLEHAWDWAYEGTSNVVDQYVRYLRKKLDAPFGRASLETVRGVGYRLNSRATGGGASV